MVMQEYQSLFFVGGGEVANRLSAARTAFSNSAAGNSAGEEPTQDGSHTTSSQGVRQPIKVRLLVSIHTDTESEQLKKLAKLLEQCRDHQLEHDPASSTHTAPGSLSFISRTVPN